jgi:hypothetical protein
MFMMRKYPLFENSLFVTIMHWPWLKVVLSKPIIFGIPDYGAQTLSFPLVMDWPTYYCKLI